MIIKSIIWIILGFFLLFSFSANSYAAETIRLGTGEYPPLYSEYMKNYGLVLHIVTQAFAMEGINVEYVFYPWIRAIRMAERGNPTGTCCWFDKPERHELFFVSEPVLSETYVFFHLKTYPFEWESLEDLKDITIGTTFEYAYSKEFREAVESKMISAESVPRDLLNLKKLLGGRIQIFPVTIEVGIHLLANEFKSEEAEKITYHPKPLLQQNTYLHLSKKIKNNEHMMTLFNHGLGKLRDSGKYHQYVEEYRK